jgi:hypothetical protein
MTTGFRDSSGVDADAKFAAYLSGTKPAVTGFRNAAGTDVRDLLQPLPGTSGGLHGHRNSAGQDFNALFSTTSEQLIFAFNGTNANDFSGGSATGQINLYNDRTWDCSGFGDPSDSGSWLLGGDPSQYEVMFQQTGGGGGILTSSHTLGTWGALNVSRYLALEQAFVGSCSRTFNANIRKQGTGTPSLTRSIYLAATVESGV